MICRELSRWLDVDRFRWTFSCSCAILILVFSVSTPLREAPEHFTARCWIRRVPRFRMRSNGHQSRDRCGIRIKTTSGDLLPAGFDPGFVQGHRGRKGV